MKKTESEIDIKKRYLVGNIKKNQEVYNIDDVTLAGRMGIAPRSIMERKRKPSIFSFEELVEVFTILNFTEAQKIESL